MATVQPTLIEKFLLYSLEITKTLSAPASRQKLFENFVKKDGNQRNPTNFNRMIPEMIFVLASMDEVTVEEKARWMFVTSTTFADAKEEKNQRFNAGLRMLKEDIEDAGVAVYNDRSQIIKYTDNGRNLKFEGVHSLKTGKNGRKQAKDVSNAPETPKSNWLKRPIATSKSQAVTATPMEKLSESSNPQSKNSNPAEQQSLQDSQEDLEPVSKRMRTEQIDNEVFHKIANMKAEIDDDIVFEGIVVKENKPVDPNIHTLGLFNCLKKFLDGVYGICNEEAIEMQKDISSLIRKMEADPNYLALDVQGLHAIQNDSLGKLVAHTTDKGQKQLNFSKVLEQLKYSCASSISVNLRKKSVKVVNYHIEEHRNLKLMISGHSLLEEIRGMIRDILNSRIESLKA